MKTKPNSSQHFFISQSYLLRLGIFLGFAALVIFPLFTASSASFQQRAAGEKAAALVTNSVLSTAIAPRLSGVAPFALMPQATPTPAIATYDPTCVTPDSEFNLGQVVCATATATGGSAARRRITWSDPDGNIRQTTAVTSDPQSDQFTIPLTATSTLSNGQVVNNIGKWRVSLVGRTLVTFATFVVKDPANATADLSVTKNAPTNSQSVAAGSNGSFDIFVLNSGPDDAATVSVVDHVPANTTFVTMVQTSGQPTTNFTCTTVPDGVGNITCSVDTMAANASATFSFVYTVNAGTAAGTSINNTVSISSATTNEPNTADNSASASASVAGGGSGGACTLNCSDDIVTPQNATNSNGDPGAIVHFTPTSSEGTCGVVTTDHCNDCFFPLGTTTVTTSTTTGDSCSFTVTVTESGSNASITCPANKTADANGDCEAVVNLGNPTASGDNVTISVSRSDGKPMYDCDANGENCVRKTTDLPFSAGITTVTWTATTHDSAGNDTGNASCQQTVTVNDTTPPVITATDSTASADATCMAPVPDYSNDVSDNCACAANDNSQDCVGQHRITTTQSIPAGTMVGLGTHTIHLTANDGSSSNNGAGNTSEKDVTFTVADTTPPVITCPPAMTANTEPGMCSAHVNPGTATATDNCDSTPTITASRSDGHPLTDPYPKGTTTITWTATDDSGNHSSCDQTITVVDNEPPVIVFNGQTPSMWPPNHKYQTFQVTNFVTGVTDNCDNVSVSSVVITKVTSDEIENGNGDGNTLNDIVIASDCKSVQLRAEREGNSNGRVYTIFFSVTDASGNVGTGTATVVVKHNPGETAVDSGPHYTVTSNCP